MNRNPFSPDEIEALQWFLGLPFGKLWFEDGQGRLAIEGRECLYSISMSAVFPRPIDLICAAHEELVLEPMREQWMREEIT